MEMNAVQLARELDELGKDINRKKELQPMLSITEKRYVEVHLPKPKPKPIQSETPPSMTRLIRTACLFLAFTTLFLVLLFNAISSFSKEKKINELSQNPGEEYKAFLASFGTVSSFEELESSWAPVEKAWGKRGVDVDWEYVTQVKDNMRGSVIYSDDFSNKLFAAIKNEKDHNSAGTTKLMFCFFSLVPAIIFAINTRARSGEYRDEKKKYLATVRENEANKSYNETEYRALLIERESKLPEVQAEYQDAMRTVREELSRVESEIAKRAHLLPSYYHDDACAIAMLLAHGRADTLKEAINLFEEDRRAAEQLAIERERTADEAYHRRAMEEEARRATEQAHQAALEQQRMMREQMVAEQQARNRAEQAARRQEEERQREQARARSAAMQRCMKCANYNACGSMRGNPNCGSFRPR